MPDLEPVSGNPFAPQLTPVSGDPFGPGIEKEVGGIRNETGWMTSPTFQERWEGLPKETQQSLDELSTKEGLENFLHPKNQEMAIQYLLRNKNKPPSGWTANQFPQSSPTMDTTTVAAKNWNANSANQSDPRYPSLLWQGDSPYSGASGAMNMPFDPDSPEVYNFRVSNEAGMTHQPQAPAHQNSSFGRKLMARGGDNQAEIDDRRGDPESGYQHMLAYNQRLRIITRYLLGLDPQGGEKGAYDQLPPPEGPPGQLEKDAGLPDIGKHLARHYQELAPTDNTQPTSWGYEPVSHDPFAEQ